MTQVYYQHLTKDSVCFEQSYISLAVVTFPCPSVGISVTTAHPRGHQVVTIEKNSLGGHNFKNMAFFMQTPAEGSKDRARNIIFSKNFLCENFISEKDLHQQLIICCRLLWSGPSSSWSAMEVHGAPTHGALAHRPMI